jgi:hypothetical protein
VNSGFFSGLPESRKFAIDFFEIFYHKNCSNDENISKKAISNLRDSCKHEKIPEFAQIVRFRANLREFGRFRANDFFDENCSNIQ